MFLEPLIAAKAKERQAATQFAGRDKEGNPVISVPQNSAEPNPIDTRAEVAKLAGVSHDTYTKGKAISANDAGRAVAQNSAELQEPIDTGVEVASRAELRHVRKSGFERAPDGWEFLWPRNSPPCYK